MTRTARHAWCEERDMARVRLVFQRCQPPKYFAWACILTSTRAVRSVAMNIVQVYRTSRYVGLSKTGISIFFFFRLVSGLFLAVFGGIRRVPYRYDALFRETG